MLLRHASALAVLLRFRWLAGAAGGSLEYPPTRWASLRCAAAWSAAYHREL